MFFFFSALYAVRVAQDPFHIIWEGMELAKDTRFSPTNVSYRSFYPCKKASLVRKLLSLLVENKIPYIFAAPICRANFLEEVSAQFFFFFILFSLLGRVEVTRSSCVNVFFGS